MRIKIINRIKESTDSNNEIVVNKAIIAEEDVRIELKEIIKKNDELKKKNSEKQTEIRKLRNLYANIEEKLNIMNSEKDKEIGHRTKIEELLRMTKERCEMLETLNGRSMLEMENNDKKELKIRKEKIQKLEERNNRLQNELEMIARIGYSKVIQDDDEEEKWKTINKVNITQELLNI